LQQHSQATLGDCSNTHRQLLVIAATLTSNSCNHRHSDQLKRHSEKIEGTMNLKSMKKQAISDKK